MSNARKEKKTGRKLLHLEDLSKLLMFYMRVASSPSNSTGPSIPLRSLKTCIAFIHRRMEIIRSEPLIMTSEKAFNELYKVGLKPKEMIMFYDCYDNIKSFQGAIF